MRTASRAAAVTLAPLNHGLGARIPASCGERDPVQRGVELPVSGTAKSVSGIVRRPDRAGGAVPL